MIKVVKENPCMERLINAVSQIKQFQLCYHCDHYDEDNMECKSEGCNCVEEIARQIRNELIDEVIEMVKSHSDDDKMMNEMYVGWIENMKEQIE